MRAKKDIYFFKIQILTSFYVVDKTNDEPIYLSGSKQLLFDITDAGKNNLHSTNPDIIEIETSKNDGKIFAIAKKIGISR